MKSEIELMHPFHLLDANYSINLVKVAYNWLSAKLVVQRIYKKTMSRARKCDRKCDKDTLVWLIGSANRLRVSQLTGVRLLCVKLFRIAKRQGYYFQWHTGIALDYRQGRRSFSFSVYVVTI